MNHPADTGSVGRPPGERGPSARPRLSPNRVTGAGRQLAVHVGHTTACGVFACVVLSSRRPCGPDVSSTVTAVKQTVDSRVGVRSLPQDSAGADLRDGVVCVLSQAQNQLRGDDFTASSEADDHNPQTSRENS
ncbi:hypothetical protein SKAU_G00029580 [Synaphobranchus kaupii]|uniref:Uncharacterized protein n=1 Tax=Synaphobranchus kaupii TaxID=118154 RepID=A0A9Q1GEP8_SYNKA|nr:hypothetical protein SKAU_G00029580 [Synaphobranchus kaupii]